MKHYGDIQPCWSCGAKGREPCFPKCECAKCQDPGGYKRWRTEHPDEYGAMLKYKNLSRRDDYDDPPPEWDGEWG